MRVSPWNPTTAVAEMGDRWATIDMGRKVGADVYLYVGWAGSPSNIVAWAEAYLRTKWHLDPSNRLATIHQSYRQTDRQTGQDRLLSDSIKRTVLETVT